MKKLYEFSQEVSIVLFQFNNIISKLAESLRIIKTEENIVNIFLSVPSLVWKHFSNNNEVISPRSKSEEGGELSQSYTYQVL